MSDMNRVYRGGCWYDSAEFCRSAYRFGYDPSDRNCDYGFRVVKETKPNINRVCRGGGWSSPAGNCRSAFRSRIIPSIRNLNCDVGFRVVKGETNE